MSPISCEYAITKIVDSLDRQSAGSLGVVSVIAGAGFLAEPAEFADSIRDF